MSIIFDLNENFVDIINNKCCLIIGAKFYNSNMNDACTIFPTQHCQLPCKSRKADCILFRKESNFCTAFVSAIGQLTQVSAHEVHLKYNI